MTHSAKITLFLLRLSLGWLFFYAGLTKLLNPTWSAAGFLKGAKTLGFFYQWLTTPTVLPIVNFLNEWGLTLLGVSLILGLFVRLSSGLGAILMFLYYLPELDFPYPNSHSFLVDEHIIYALVLIFLANIRAGRIYGLANWCSQLPICRKFPKIQNWIG